MTLVVDASAALWACTNDRGFGAFAEELAAPPLLWSEGHSVLHARMWRGDLRRSDAEALRRRLASAPVDRVEPDELRDVAWQIADELGVARTYDAEYLALARLLGTRVVTGDVRLRRGADRLGLVIGLDELSS